MSAYDNIKVKKVKKEDVPALEPVEITPVEETPATPVETPAAPQFKHTSWWHTPNYLKATEELQAAGRERMKLEEKRAERNRNIALLGDMARLVGQMYIRNGGGYVEKFTPQTQIENEKLAAIRDKNAAQIMAYSKELQAARKADAENFAKRLQTEQKMEKEAQAKQAKADKEAYDRAWERYKQGKTEEYREEQLAQAKAREARLAGQGGYSGETARVFDEYQEMIAENPELAVMKKVAKRDESGFYVKDENGNQVYEEVEELNPTINQARNALAKGKIKTPENKKTPVKGFGDVKAKKEVKGF